EDSIWLFPPTPVILNARDPSPSVAPLEVCHACWLAPCGDLDYPSYSRGRLRSGRGSGRHQTSHGPGRCLSQERPTRDRRLGGRSYNCPVDAGESQRLLAVLRDEKEAAKGPGREATPGSPATVPQPSPGLTPVRPALGLGSGDGDNSNTQFATLALRVARRHKLKADATLAAVEMRFRAMQQADGGWPYNSGTISTASMTC